MTTFDPVLSKKLRNSLLTVLALTALLTPTCTMAAEREGTVLFFSCEDLKQALSHPSLPSLSQLSPSFARRDQHEPVEREGPIERNYRWGNGLGFDGYADPWTRRPLWGY